MVEAGFIEHWKYIHSVSSRCGGKTAAVKLRPTQLEDTSGLYIVLCSGGILALLSLIGETVARMVQRKRLRIASRTRCVGGSPSRNANYSCNSSETNLANGDLSPGYVNQRCSPPVRIDMNGFDRDHLSPVNCNRDFFSATGQEG